MFSFFSRKPAQPAITQPEPTPPTPTPPPASDTESLHAQHQQQPNQLHTPSPSVDTDIAAAALGGSTASAAGVVNLNDDADMSISVAGSSGVSGGKGKGKGKGKARAKQSTTTTNETGTTTKGSTTKPRKPRAKTGTAAKKAANVKDTSVQEDGDGASPLPAASPDPTSVEGLRAEAEEQDKDKEEQPITDPSELYALIASVPPQTLHAYTLTHLRPPPPLPLHTASPSAAAFVFPARPGPSSHSTLSPFLNSQNQNQPQQPDAQTLTILTRFFRTLEPPPKLHCVRCHRGYFELENNDMACRVPHDDDSAIVERVRVAVGSTSGSRRDRDGGAYSSSPERGGGSPSARKRIDTRSKRREIESEYETTYGCCGRTVAGDGDMGPPDGWCYEGAHTVSNIDICFLCGYMPVSGQMDGIALCIIYSFSILLLFTHAYMNLYTSQSHRRTSNAPGSDSTRHRKMIS